MTTYSDGQLLKDLLVQDGLVNALRTSDECSKQFVSVQSGIENIDDIPSTKCPALRVGFLSMSHNRERFSPVEEEVIAQYAAYVIIKGTQPKETEERLLRCINAVRIALEADTSLGNVALDATAKEVTRETFEGREPFDAAEILIEVLYLKEPKTGQ